MCPRLLTPRTREELKYAVVEGADTTAHVTEWGSDAKNKKLVLFRTADVRASDCPLPFALSPFHRSPGGMRHATGSTHTTSTPSKI